MVDERAMSHERTKLDERAMNHERTTGAERNQD